MDEFLDGWETNTRCPLCQSEGIHYHKVVHSIPFVKARYQGIEMPMQVIICYWICMDCGLLFQNPHMTSETLDKFYADGIYREIYGHGDFEQRRIDRLVEFVRGYAFDSHLDVGCGKGLLIEATRHAYACESVGLEWGEKPKGMFDLVSSIHVLEHTLDPLAHIKSLMAHANKYILIEVPRIDNPGYLAHTLEIPTWTLHRLLKMAGLEIVKFDDNPEWATVLACFM